MADAVTTPDPDPSLEEVLAACRGVAFLSKGDDSDAEMFLVYLILVGIVESPDERVFIREVLSDRGLLK